MSWWLSSLAWKIAWAGWLTGTVPAAGLARPGDGFPGLGKHVPHSPIHAQERHSGQSVCALWPSGICSCSGQCQELPIACSARGGALLSGYVLQALVAGLAGLASHVLDWTQGCALAYDEQSWPESAMWRGCVLGKTTDEAESEYIQIWKRERKRERHGNVHHTVHKRLVPAGPWPQQCRLRDVPHGHSFAQGPGAVGWHVPSRWCAQGEEHGVDFQEPRHPLGGEPHAACRHKGWPSQEVHGSSQVTQVPGHLQAGPQATLPWRHLRLIRCATSECLMPDWSGCHFRLTHNSPVCHAPRANWTWRACCPCR